MRGRTHPGGGRLRLLALALLAGTMASASAATDFYIFIPGVPGEATSTDRKNWIDAFGFGAVIHRAKGQPRPNFPGVSVSKSVDKASPLLNHAVASGAKFQQVILETVDQSTRQVIYKIVLDDVMVSAAVQAGDGNALHEDLELNYSRIEWSYTSSTAPTATTHFDNNTGGGGTGPLPGATPLADSDNDGIPDSYEVANGLNASANDASGDIDGDGTTNLAEYVARTRANDAKSVFRVSGISQADGSMLIKWTSVADKIYHITASTSLSGPYTTVKQNIRSAGDGETSTSVNVGGERLFFKVLTQ